MAESLTRAFAGFVRPLVRAGDGRYVRAMPDWVANELKVTGDADAVRRFVEAVAGRDSNGHEIPFSLSAVDPMPAEYGDGTSYRDSDEYKTLLAAHQALTSDEERLAFIRANPGFAS